MSKQFSQSEHFLLSLAVPGAKFEYQGMDCTILISGKPRSSSGEPKTDIYIEYSEEKSRIAKELKISFKQKNADFLENKITKERAEQILGSDWSLKINKSLQILKDNFHTRKLIFKSKSNKTMKGSFTLGWKFELLNKPGGELSGELILSKSEIINIFAGTNLDEDKKNSRVGSKIVLNSGVASHILNHDVDKIKTIQDFIDNIISIEPYISNNKNSKIFFACKALNYRSFEKKFDGNRPLSVFVDWSITENKLKGDIILDKPLQYKGNSVNEKLKHSLDVLNISTTDDISEVNVLNYKSKVFE